MVTIWARILVKDEVRNRPIEYIFDNEMLNMLYQQVNYLLCRHVTTLSTTTLIIIAK